jgi:hypothetical protein
MPKFGCSHVEFRTELGRENARHELEILDVGTFACGTIDVLPLQLCNSLPVTWIVIHGVAKNTARPIGTTIELLILLVKVCSCDDVQIEIAA